MNEAFKEEFKQLSIEKLKAIINGCAGRDLLEKNLNETLTLSETSYHMKHINSEDDYGFWIVQWKYKKVTHENMPMSTWMFENSIKITPFRIEFENKNTSFNPFTHPHHRKQLEEYIFIYINQCCPNYINAIREETDRFIKMISFNETKKNNSR